MAGAEAPRQGPGDHGGLRPHRQPSGHPERQGGAGRPQPPLPRPPWANEEINKMLSERAGDEFLASVSGVIKSRLEESGIEGATIKRRVKSIYGIYRKTIMQNKSLMKFTTSTRCASSWTPWLSATAPWASSTICTTRCPTASKTISLPQAQRLPEPPHHRHRPRGHPL